jgi:hypothetical protein
MHAIALSRLACCSRVWRNLCDDEKLWERLFYAHGGQLWERSYATFKQCYIQRFGPIDRPIAATGWGATVMRSVNFLRSWLVPTPIESRILVLGLDNAGKTTILCEKAVSFVFSPCLTRAQRQI